MENTDKTQSNNPAAKADNKTADNQSNKNAGAKLPNSNASPVGGGGQTSAANSQSAAPQSSGDISDTVKDTLNQAKETTGQVASQAYGIAAKKATSVIDEQKTNLTQGLSSVADSIRQIGENLRGTDEPTGVANMAAQYTNTAADKVKQISGYLDRRDLSGLVKDLKSLAQSNPALFLGGAFTLGIVAARFFKSGSPNQALTRRSQYSGADFRAPKNRDDQVRTSNPNNDKTSGGTATSVTSPNNASQNKGG